jgi:CRP-like cAMP-binding protein
MQDFQQLLSENPVAQEQLRRIMAERKLREAETKLAEMNGTSEEAVPEPEEVK